MPTTTAPGPIWIRDISTNDPPFWVNSVAVSNNGKRVLCGTFIHDYSDNSSRFGPNEAGTFCTSCYDAKGKQLWTDAYEGMDGVFSVAVSGNGKIAAQGGWLDAKHGLLRAYDAATGKILLDYSEMPQRVSTVALSNDGSILAAASDHIYIFAKSGNKFPAAPTCLPFGPNEFLTSVAVHPTGKWIAACSKKGVIRVAELSKGVVTKTYIWTAPEGKLFPDKSDSKTAPMPFLAVAISRKSDAFVVGGGDMVYRSTLRNMQKGKDPTGFDTRDANAPFGPTRAGRYPENVRWVGISGNGKLISAAVNRTVKKKFTGALYTLGVSGGKLKQSWKVLRDSNPNSTSLDDKGKFVTVCDGFPVTDPGNFAVYDAKTGALRWDYEVSYMNWPMFISANGNAIAAGGDDGKLYYFKP
ncbi:MAG: hypothetical protein ABL967_09855 [Bryobacteraceae bacterium]